MLNDVGGSIAFSLASPDPFTSITGAQGEPALICEKHRAPVADMPILVFYSKCQSSSTVLGSEHRAHYRTSRPEATLMIIIIIREVQLKSCHTLIKKCSFNFFEQCIIM